MSILALALGLLGTTQAAPLQLHVDGNKIKDSNNNIVRLQGANIPSLEWHNTGENIVGSQTHLRDVWKANLIRFPLSQDRWFGHAPGQSDGGAAYRAVVDGIVSRASAGNYYVLLDLHWSNKGVWGSNIAQAVMPDMNSVIFWTDCANRYKNNPAVLFDLYNEPHPSTWEVWRNGGTVTESASGITYTSPGMQGLLNAVRATGANNVVVVGGMAYAFDLSGIMNGYALTDTSSGKGIVYASHIYPWKNNLDAKVTVAAASHPILIGECGADTNPEPVGGPVLDTQGVINWSNNHIAWMNSHGYHWTGWAFHKSAGPKMISDFTNYTPTTWGQIAKNQMVTATLPPQTTGLVKVNAGGTATSPFAADSNYNAGAASTPWSGAIVTTGVSNPAPVAVYRSQRAGNMTYTFNGISPGPKVVRLHFCENTYNTVGSRRFNVSINANPKLTNFDIRATAGAINKANVQQFTVYPSSTGVIYITFTGVTGAAIVNGIEIN